MFILVCFFYLTELHLRDPTIRTGSTLKLKQLLEFLIKLYDL